MARLLILAIQVGAAVSLCTVKDGPITALFKVANNNLLVDFTNTKAENGQWTALAFGEDMSSLEVYVLSVSEGRVKAETGSTAGYESPPLDGRGSLPARLLSFSSGTLHSRFSRAMKDHGPRGHSLEDCETVSLAAGPLSDEGDIDAHFQRPYQTKVCFSSCQ